MRDWHLAFILLCALLLNSDVHGSDWPAWRFDAGHTAASPHALPESLRLEWTRADTPREQVWDDPLNHDLMPYDRVFEPIIAGGLMIVGYNDSDKVVAYDLETGKIAWQFFTGAPVRFPAVAWKDVVLFCSDDSVLYCVHQSSGELKWSFRGAPSERKAIGNRRMISAWPARGGPVVADDQVYFAASIWPFMGTFIYCLDAESGRPVWVNDSTSSQYIKQPHSANSFAGIGPQGTLGVAGDYLLVPGGRSVPAAFDRHTGEMRHYLLNEGGKGNGGSLVLAQGDEFFVHTRRRGIRAFDLKSGNKTAFMTNEPVLAGDMIYAAEIKLPPKQPAEGAAAAEEEEGGDEVPVNDPATQPGAVPVIRAYRSSDKSLVWELEQVDGTGDLILAGNRLYAAGGNTITAIACPGPGEAASVCWTVKLDGSIQRLLAGAEKLIAVTLEGSIHCLGASELATVAHTAVHANTVPGVDQPEINELLRATTARGGWLLYYGNAEPRLLDDLLARTQFELVVVDPRADQVPLLRQHYDELGIYGKRISIHHGDPESFAAPPYVAHVVLMAAASLPQGTEAAQTRLKLAYDSVRPYGGCLVVLPSADRNLTQISQALTAANLEQVSVEATSSSAVARRVGALPGAGDWTHQYGDIANTVKSDDARVKLPLGILWFGGSSNLDVLPRHGHGPPEQVIGGRLFIEGMNSLSCRDVYTGRVLWHREFDNLGTFDIYYDDTYKDTPLDPAYNQVHIPGANGRGTNVVATEDAVYILEGSDCHVLDVETGETRYKISMPPGEDGTRPEWAFLGVYDDVLLGGSGFFRYARRGGYSITDLDKALSGNSKGYGFKSLESSASAGLVAFDRHTGDVLWRAEPRHSFIHNGIVAGDGTVFCLDKVPQLVEDQLRRRGISAPDTYRIAAFDVRTGEPRWEFADNIGGTWLGYSEEYHLLLHAGAAAGDRLKSEVGQGMLVLRGDTGQVAWRVDDRAYSGPCILHHDTILTNANSYSFAAGAFSLLDGSPKMIKNPLTKQEQPWTLSRTYGCNTIIASENFLTFRSGAAGFYDLQTMSGTGNLGGFKSGCTSNLVVANGVLNAPDYTRTCSCGYQNQTSLALVHMPEMDMWTVNYTARLSTPGATVQHLGVNIGAPGDRTDDSGTLWIDYPPVGGDSVEMDIVTNSEATFYRRNSLGFQGPGLPWIGSSGVLNVRRLVVPMTVKGSPDEVRVRVRSSADDAEENGAGEVNLTSSDLELVEDASAQSVGIRFTNLNIPAHRKVLAAHIQFTCDEAATDETQVTFAVESSDHSQEFSTSPHSISQRQWSESTVAWKIAGWDKVDSAGEKERSPDLAELVRQVIARPGWKEGNALAFVVRGSGKRIAKSYDGAAEAAPELIITLEAEPPKDVPLTAHTVRLVFAEPDSLLPGQRQFDVQLAGRTVESGFDVAAAAGGPNRTIVREYRDIMIGSELAVEFIPRVGEPILSGLEVIRQ